MSWKGEIKVNRNRKKIIEPVYVPEDLQQFLSWEIRKINVSDCKPGIILQNPLSGEIRKLLINPSCFGGEGLNVIRGKKQPSRTTLTSKKGVEENEKK